MRPGPPCDPTKLYTSPALPTHWIAWDEADEGWCLFPAISGGWGQRRPFRGHANYLDPVPAAGAIGTGWPGAARPDAAWAPDPAELARRIRAERDRLGLSQAEAAKRLGVSRSTYRQLEDGANPRADTLVGLVRVLGMRGEALLPEILEGP